MSAKKYELYKTAKKTAKENGLVYVDGNNMTDAKSLFDFGFLETLDIPENELNIIKAEAMKYCSAANKTAFIIHDMDNFTMLNAIVDFAAHKVFSTETWKMKFVILTAKHVQYSHAERKSVYDIYYNENVRSFESSSVMTGADTDLEV